MTDSYEDLLALTKRIAADSDDIARAGMELHRWGPNSQGTAVEMLVRGAARSAQAYMDAHYGEGNVIVRHTDEPPGQRL